jgi:hypothetical protein
LSMAANQVAVGAFRRAVNDTFLDTQPLYGVYCHMPKAKLSSTQDTWTNREGWWK